MKPGVNLRQSFLLTTIAMVILLLFLPCFAWVEENTELVFQGKIDGEMPFRMRLTLKDGMVSGGIIFNEGETEYPLVGRTDFSGGLYLEDRDETGKVYAVFDGVFVNDSLIEGFWSRLDQEGKLIFEAEIPNAPKQERQPWKGVWRRINTAPFDWADLYISKVTDSGCYFQLEAGSGVITRKASGTALFYGNEAVWEDQLTGERIRFIWSGHTLRLETDDSRGRGVVFSGEYRPGFQPLPELDLIKLGVFSDAQKDQVFRKLVGDDYRLFAESFQFVKHSVDDDGFGAMVRTGFVRGMAGLQEAIIMVTPELQFWAAVADPENNVIKYYTNVPAYKEKMPQTIVEWVQRINDDLSMEVLFCTK